MKKLGTENRKLVLARESLRALENLQDPQMPRAAGGRDLSHTRCTTIKNICG